LLLELWKPAAPELQAVVDTDRARARASVAQALYRRRIADYCEEHRKDEADLTKDVKAEILARATAMYEEFLAGVVGRKVALDKALFEPPIPGTTAASAVSSDSDLGEAE
jgi:hypothetical protein